MADLRPARGAITAGTADLRGGGRRRFRRELVTWHKRWLLGAPVDYWVFAGVAATLFCSSRTIDRWVKRFEHEGLDGLRGRKRGRRGLTTDGSRFYQQARHLKSIMVSNMLCLLAHDEFLAPARRGPAPLAEYPVRN